MQFNITKKLNMKVYLYILGYSNNPDEITTSVPYKVNEKEIFFGPCKINMREELKKLFQINKLDKDTYIVGLNGSYTNRAGMKIRKIVWAGRISRIMTFGEAFEELLGNNYKVMRNCKNSPLHVKPIFNNDKSAIIGYSRRSELHSENDKWIKDLIKDQTKVKIIKNSILLKDLSEYDEVFIIDACIILENIFCANGKGININKAIIKILKKAQPEIDNIDQYYVFGKDQNGHAVGKRGRWLELRDDIGKELIDTIKIEKIKINSEMVYTQKPIIHLKKECNC